MASSSRTSQAANMPNSQSRNAVSTVRSFHRRHFNIYRKWQSRDGNTQAPCTCYAPGADVFHFLRPITAHLRPHHERFDEALQRLSFCIWNYRQADVNNVCTALLKGTLGNTKLMRQEVNALKHSGKLYTKFSAYIRHVTYNVRTMHNNITEWSAEFVTSTDDRNSDRRTGERLALPSMMQALTTQLSNLSAIEDLEDRLRSPPNSKAPQKFKHHRGCLIETFHSQVGDMANPSGAELAAALTEMGACRVLTQREQEMLYRLEEANECTVLHYGTWDRRRSNELTEEAGMPPPFSLVGPAPTDGVRFLFESEPLALWAWGQPCVRVPEGHLPSTENGTPDNGPAARPVQRSVDEID